MAGARPGYLGVMSSYTSAEVEIFRGRQRRAWDAAVVALLMIAVGAVFAIGAAGSYLVGLIAAVVIVTVGFEVIRRWNRARWLRQFPELRTRSFSWLPDSR